MSTSSLVSSLARSHAVPPPSPHPPAPLTMHRRQPPAETGGLTGPWRTISSLYIQRKVRETILSASNAPSAAVTRKAHTIPRQNRPITLRSKTFWYPDGNVIINVKILAFNVAGRTGVPVGGGPLPSSPSTFSPKRRKFTQVSERSVAISTSALP